MSRLAASFAALKTAGRCAFVPFIMAHDPNPGFSREVLWGLPAAGADVIELGIPFSDPMADGPVIQAAGLRSLAHGTTLAQVLALVRDFRVHHQTPIVLMGYYNPLYSYGVEAFARDAAAAGVDGVIIVDVPPEEDSEVLPAFQAAGLDLVRLIAPTTPPARMAAIAAHASGFLYYVAIKGVTGAASADEAALQIALAEVRRQTALPLGLGFGIKTPAQAGRFAAFADAVIVGSSIVERMDGQHTAEEVLAYVRTLAEAVHV